VEDIVVSRVADVVTSRVADIVTRRVAHIVSSRDADVVTRRGTDIAKKSLKIPERELETVNRRRTDNTMNMAKRKKDIK
jgi:hypothetical protein